MRGKVINEKYHARITRITPAHAGKSTSTTTTPTTVQDHPRACGEKLSRCKGDHHESWDHPRACGEKLCLLLMVLARLGSPPRMRGKGVARPLQTLQKRITPAHAGKRHLDAIKIEFNEDHPRACGEKARGKRTSTAKPGSPPRMRGKGISYSSYNQYTRITPAHAGKRTTSSPSAPFSRDHPRACGEQPNTPSA